MEVNWSDVRLPLTEGLKDQIVQVTGLPSLDGWRDLGGSWSTNVSALQPDHPRAPVFRIHQRFVDHDRLQAEQHARQVLASLGLPTACALPLFSGATIGRLPNGNLIEAEPLIVSDANMDTADRLIDGFAVLGAVHDALRTSPLPAAAHAVSYANHLDAELIEDRTRTGIDRITSWRIPELTAFADRFADHLAEVREQEAAVPVDGLRHVVHGDFWDNNVLFARGRVVAVLDFGFMAERARIDDLALPIWYYLLGQPPADPATLGVVVAMVDAYDSATSHPLTTGERLALPLVIARQLAWLVGRWVPFEGDEQQAQVHARRAAAEFPVATAILADLRAWQQSIA